MALLLDFGDHGLFIGLGYGVAFCLFCFFAMRAFFRLKASEKKLTIKNKKKS